MLRFTLLALLFAVPPGALDPRVGTWTLISAQSTLTPPDKLTITELNQAVHVVMSGETHLDFTAKPDGKDTPVPGNPGFNQVELHRAGKRQVQVDEKKDGAPVATIRGQLSPDRNELTVTTAAIGHPGQATVWTRTAGPIDPHDPLAGDWTQDAGKTRLRQGLVLKIEPSGDGAVRFTGDFSYTARFDGKPYDLRNSRNDTVVLAVVDPHTVDASYQRDGQTTQRDRYAVSADGQQMTLTSTSKLETGQQLSEKLVFKKQ